MLKVFIIGARGSGREFYGGLKKKSLSDKEYLIKGFLDDKSNALDGFSGYPPIISSVEEHEVQEDDRFICSLGEPKAREKYINIIKSKKGIFLTLISPNAYVSDMAEIGEGVTISRFCTINENTKIGDFTYIHSYSTLGHDSCVGKFCSLGAYTFLGGYAKIGNRATLHTRTTVLPRVTVGDDSVTGAGSVVIRNVQPGITVFGNPAKKVTY